MAAPSSQLNLNFVRLLNATKLLQHHLQDQRNNADSDMKQTEIGRLNTYFQELKRRFRRIQRMIGTNGDPGDVLLADYQEQLEDMGRLNMEFQQNYRAEDAHGPGLDDGHSKHLHQRSNIDDTTDKKRRHPTLHSRTQSSEHGKQQIDGGRNDNGRAAGGEGAMKIGANNKMRDLRRELGLHDNGIAHHKGSKVGGEQSRLATERLKQAQLTTGLLGSAARLKEAVMGANADMKQNMAVETSVSEKIDCNITAISRTNAEIEAYSAQCCMRFFQQSFLIVLAVAMFFGTYLFMKIVPKPK